MTEAKRVIFNGLEYVQSSNGYYFQVIGNKGRKDAPQLHKAVWEFYNQKKIPKGYHIHHKDFDNENNDPANLEIMKASDHLSLHGKRNYENPEFARKAYANLDRIRDSAKEWHRSPEGLAWHKQHVQESIGKSWERSHECICTQCGKTFMATIEGALYCCDKCGNRHRHEFGKKYTKNCIVCGKEYQTKLPKKAKYCSSKCRGVTVTKYWKDAHPEGY
jgi:hypothetical protein